jgi:hypothetical protein
MSQNVHFPDTQHSWISWKLQLGVEGREEVMRHIMGVYALPLQSFVPRAFPWIREEPMEIVCGFFSSRVDNPAYLQRWHESGLRLRTWLMKGCSYYCREHHRTQARLRTGKDLPDRAHGGDDPVREYERSVACCIIRSALVEGAQMCEAQGLTSHWKLFLGHHRDGAPYTDLVRDLGVTPGRAAVMARTASKRFADSLRRLLRRDGVSEEELASEMRSLLEALSR